MITCPHGIQPLEPCPDCPKGRASAAPRLPRSFKTGPAIGTKYKKPGEYKNCRSMVNLQPDLHKVAKKYAKKERISLSQAIERALVRLLNDC